MESVPCIVFASSAATSHRGEPSGSHLTSTAKEGAENITGGALQPSDARAVGTLPLYTQKSQECSVPRYSHPTEFNRDLDKRLLVSKTCIRVKRPQLFRRGMPQFPHRQITTNYYCGCGFTTGPARNEGRAVSGENCTRMEVFCHK